MSVSSAYVFSWPVAERDPVIAQAVALDAHPNNTSANGTVARLVARVRATPTGRLLRSGIVVHPMPEPCGDGSELRWWREHAVCPAPPPAAKHHRKTTVVGRMVERLAFGA